MVKTCKQYSFRRRKTCRLMTFVDIFHRSTTNKEPRASPATSVSYHHVRGEGVEFVAAEATEMVGVVQEVDTAACGCEDGLS